MGVVECFFVLGISVPWLPFSCMGEGGGERGPRRGYVLFFLLCGCVWGGGPTPHPPLPPPPPPPPEKKKKRGGSRWPLKKSDFSTFSCHDGGKGEGCRNPEICAPGSENMHTGCTHPEIRALLYHKGITKTPCLGVPI